VSILAGARTAVNTCLQVKKGEKVLILTDTIKEDIGEAVFWAAKEVPSEAMLLRMLPRSRHGEEVPKPIAEIMKNVDVVLAPTQYSISHTQARKEANLAGARIATMPMITEDMMSKGGMTADFKGVARHADRLLKKIGKANEVHVKTPEGTNIKFSITGRKWLADTGMLHAKGAFGNLPAGELFLPPVEGTAEGMLVVTGALAGVGLLKQPIRMTVKKGFVVDINGGPHANKFKGILLQAGRDLDEPGNAFNIAEFGIGLNPKAKLIGNPLEDEKVLGTVHMAVGDNSTFGGKVRAGVHLDGIILNPTVLMDGEKLEL